MSCLGPLLTLQGGCLGFTRDVDFLPLFAHLSTRKVLSTFSARLVLSCRIDHLRFGTPFTGPAPGCRIEEAQWDFADHRFGKHQSDALPL